MIMTNNTFSKKNVAAWLSCKGKTYTGDSLVKTRSAVIISGDTELGRQALVKNMVDDFSSQSRKKIKVVSARSFAYESDVTYDKVFVRKAITSGDINKMFSMRPDIIILDAKYDEHAFDILHYPHFFGAKVLYVINADGNDVEELRKNTVENYLTSIKQSNLDGINKLMVSRIVDLGAENPFDVTEFSPRKRV